MEARQLEAPVATPPPTIQLDLTQQEFDDLILAVYAARTDKLDRTAVRVGERAADKVFFALNGVGVGADSGDFGGIRGLSPFGGARERSGC